MALSILGGGLASVVMARWLVEGRAGFGYQSFTLGALFGGVGWFLAENIGEAAFLREKVGSELRFSGFDPNILKYIVQF